MVNVMHVKVLLFLLMFLPNAAFAAVDMFLKIDDVMGESMDAVHRDEIDVLAWSWGTRLNQRVPCIEGLSVTKWVDQSTPDLLLGQIEGRVYNEAVLTVRKAGERPLEFLVLTFRNAFVSSLSTGGSGGEERLTENVTLNFESLKYEYIKQNPDGSTSGTKTVELTPGYLCR